MQIIYIITTPSWSIYEKIKLIKSLDNYNIIFLPKMLRNIQHKDDLLSKSVRKSIIDGDLINNKDLSELLTVELINYDRNLIIGFPSTVSQIHYICDMLKVNKSNCEHIGIFIKNDYKNTVELENWYLKNGKCFKVGFENIIKDLSKIIKEC